MCEIKEQLYKSLTEQLYATTNRNGVELIEILNSKGINESDISDLLSGTTSGIFTEREKFIRMMINEIIFNGDLNLTNEKISQQGITSKNQAHILLEKLFNKNSELIQQWKKAIKEEENSREFVLNIIINSIKEIKTKNPEKKLVIFIGGPSSSGKSFYSKHIIHSTIESEQRKNPEYYNNRTEENVLFFLNDGGITRETSPMRRLVLETAISKGYSGITNLDSQYNVKFKKLFTDFTLNCDKVNVVIPTTFVNSDSIKTLRTFEDIEKYGLCRNYMMEITPFFDSSSFYTREQKAVVDGEFKAAVKYSGDLRAWYPQYGKIFSQDNALDSIRLDRKPKCESKKYDVRNFESGVKQSNKFALKFNEKYGNDRYFKVRNGRIIVQESEIEINKNLKTPILEIVDYNKNKKIDENKMTILSWSEYYKYKSKFSKVEEDFFKKTLINKKSEIDFLRNKKIIGATKIDLDAFLLQHRSSKKMTSNFQRNINCFQKTQINSNKNSIAVSALNTLVDKTLSLKRIKWLKLDKKKKNIINQAYTISEGYNNSSQKSPVKTIIYKNDIAKIDSKILDKGFEIELLKKYSINPKKITAIVDSKKEIGEKDKNYRKTELELEKKLASTPINREEVAGLISILMENITEKKDYSFPKYYYGIGISSKNMGNGEFIVEKIYRGSPLEKFSEYIKPGTKLKLFSGSQEQLLNSIYKFRSGDFKDSLENIDGVPFSEIEKKPNIEFQSIKPAYFIEGMSLDCIIKQAEHTEDSEFKPIPIVDEPKVWDSLEPRVYDNIPHFKPLSSNNEEIIRQIHTRQRNPIFISTR